MRGWLTIGVVACWLLAAGVARGEVLTPADPELLGHCGAASGDLVAAGRLSDRSEDLPIEVSERGGPPQAMRGIRGCPVVASADDGTAILGGSSRDESALLVRGPGGRFQRVLAMPGWVAPIALGAASGGWAAAAWVEGDVDTRQRVIAMVFRPDGSADRRVLDRVAGGAGHLSSPGVGIDEGGTATFAWAAWRGESRQRIRTARAVRGSEWTPVRALPAGGRMRYFDSRQLVDVAVSPAGRTLVAWTTNAGIAASIDGGPADFVRRTPGAGSPDAAVSDDGSALIAYATPSFGNQSDIAVADRAPGAATWSSHPLSEFGTQAYSGVEAAYRRPATVKLAVALGADGAAAVAWDSRSDFGLSVVAAVGRVGGDWSPGAVRSLVTRSARLGTVSLDATGQPLVLWSEGPFGFYVDPRRDRLRGARLAAEAPTPDLSAPVLTTSLPARVRLNRRGRFLPRIAVACSEACDVRVRLLRSVAYLPEPFEEASEAGALKAGAGMSIALVTDRDERPGLWRRAPRRLRLEVVATDRAGNVTRRSRAVAVQRVS